MSDDFTKLHGIPRPYKATGSCAASVKVCEDFANEVCPICNGSKEIRVKTSKHTHKYIACPCQRREAEDGT